MNNGWIAYTKIGNMGQTQVWIKSPDGQERQISYFGTSSIIDKLEPNGDIIWINNGRRYLGSFNSLNVTERNWGMHWRNLLD